MPILMVSTQNHWEKLSDRINRIIGLVLLNGESLSGSALEVNLLFSIYILVWL